MDKRLIQLIRHALSEYKMAFHSDDEGNSIDLVDIVTPETDDDISGGEVELDLLAEHIADYLSVLQQHPKQSGGGGE